MDANRDDRRVGRRDRDEDDRRANGPAPPIPLRSPPLPTPSLAPDRLASGLGGRIGWGGIARRLFFAHAGVYAAINSLLFFTDLADGGNWWFFYPLFGWGTGLAAHAGLTFGLGGTDRNARPPAVSVASESSAPVSPLAAAPGPTTPAELAQEAEARVAKLWRTARLIPTPAVREQAFRICAAADRIAEAMAKRPPDAQTAYWFLDRYLTPTEAVLDRYVRLATRDVAAAEPALTKVETHDLPLLEEKLDEFYQRLHRGDLIDLEVASQMLEFDLESAPPKPTRSTS